MASTIPSHTKFPASYSTYFFFLLASSTQAQEQVAHQIASHCQASGSPVWVARRATTPRLQRKYHIRWLLELLSTPELPGRRRVQYDGFHECVRWHNLTDLFLFYDVFGPSGAQCCDYPLRVPQGHPAYKLLGASASFLLLPLGVVHLEHQLTVNVQGVASVISLPNDYLLQNGRSLLDFHSTAAQ